MMKDMFDLKEFELKLKQILDHAKGELASVRANRPSPQLVEDIMVEYMGSTLAVKQLATINVTGPREIQIHPWDKESAIAIGKAIETRNSGLSVTVQGAMIRLTLPMLSDERRVELTKIVKQMVERSKIAIRDVRDSANKTIDRLVKEKALTKDDQFSLKRKVQDAVDRANRELESQLAMKTKEVGE